MNSLEQRLNRLERQNRRLTLTVIVTLLGATFSLTRGTGVSQEEARTFTGRLTSTTIDSNGLHLRGAGGAVIEIGFNAVTQNGESRMVPHLVAGALGGGAMNYGALTQSGLQSLHGDSYFTARPYLSAGLLSNGPGVELSDNNGTVRSEFDIDSNHNPQLALYDVNRNQNARILLSNGQYHIGLLQGATPLWQAPPTPTPPPAPN